MQESNSHIFKGHSEGNLFYSRFIFDGLETQSFTNKSGFRSHDYITAIFVNIFGSGTIDIQTNEGTIYLNKGSVKELLAKKGSKEADSNDSSSLKAALEVLLQPKQDEKNHSTVEFTDKNKQLQDDPFISLETFESFWLDGAESLQQDCSLVNWNGESVKKFWDTHVREEKNPEKAQFFIEETFPQLSDKEIAAIIDGLLKEKPAHYLEKVAIAFHKIREPFDYIALFNTFSESSSEEELLMGCTVLSRLKERLQQEKSLLLTHENATEEEIQFSKEQGLKKDQWKKTVEAFELKCNNCFIQKFLFTSTKNPFDLLQKVDRIAPQIIDSNKITLLFTIFQKYNGQKHTETGPSWKNCLQLLYTRVLKSKEILLKIKQARKTKLEQIRNIVAPETDIPW